MMLEYRYKWPIPQLIKLSGEDAAIIMDSKTDAGAAGKFAVVGLLVLVIFGLSVYSSVHFLLNLLNGSRHLAMAIGFLWGAMVANIYYLLLFTITPPILKGREWAVKGISKEVTTEKRLLSSVSLVFRLLFVILLAIIIAQPWLVTIFNTSQWINQSRETYRAKILQLENFHNSAPADFEHRRIVDQREIDRLLFVNNFYTRKIQIINSHYPLAWFATFLVVLFFIIPIVIKYHVRRKTNFYVTKRTIEMLVVQDSYNQFKHDYSEIFTDRFGIATEWYESCTDAPFNTQRKGEQEKYSDQSLLIEKIYGMEANLEDLTVVVNQMDR
jgi:Domain of unknown function (DUF4407)